MTAKTNWDQLQEALSGLRKSSPNGFTAWEFADKIKCSCPLARRKIGELINAGKLEFIGNRSVTRIDGRPGATPVYAQKKARVNRA